MQVCLSAGWIQHFRSLFFSWYSWKSFTSEGAVDSYSGESKHLCGLMSKLYYDAVARPKWQGKQSENGSDSPKWNSKPVFTWWPQQLLYRLFKDSGPLTQLGRMQSKSKSSCFLQHWLNAFQWAGVSLVIYCPFLFFYVLYLSFLQWQFHL